MIKCGKVRTCSVNEALGSSEMPAAHTIRTFSTTRKSHIEITRKRLLALGADRKIVGGFLSYIKKCIIGDRKVIEEDLKQHHRRYLSRSFRWPSRTRITFLSFKHLISALLYLCPVNKIRQDSQWFLCRYHSSEFNTILRNLVDHRSRVLDSLLYSTRTLPDARTVITKSIQCNVTN